MNKNEKSTVPTTGLVSFLIFELQRVLFNECERERALAIFGQLENAAREVIDENQSMKKELESLKGRIETHAKAVEILNSYKGAELATKCDVLSGENKMILLNKLHAAFLEAVEVLGVREYRVSDIRDVFEALVAVCKTK